MSKPSNSINKIKMPGETNPRLIIPQALWDGTTNYQATLPTLTADSTIALASQLNNYVTLNTYQTITGNKNIRNASLNFLDPTYNYEGSFRYHAPSDGIRSLRMSWWNDDDEEGYDVDIGQEGFTIDEHERQETFNLFWIKHNFFYMKPKAINFGGSYNANGWPQNYSTLLFPTLGAGQTKTIATVDQLPVIEIVDLTN